MEKITITRDDAITAMEAAVEEKGADYVYEASEDTGSCVYVRGGEPSCIVGNALHRLGVPVEVLAECDYLDTTAFGLIMDGNPGGQSEVEGFLSEHGVEIEPDAVTVMRVAQSAQDNMRSWGYALELAKIQKKGA